MPTTRMDFIGREQEITFLDHWLADENAPSIVYIHDELKEKEKKGGIGKTWLLHRFHEMVEQHENIIPLLLDFFDVQDRDGVVIAGRVVQAVKNKYPRWTAENFDRLIQDYHEGER